MPQRTSKLVFVSGRRNRAGKDLTQADLLARIGIYERLGPLQPGAGEATYRRARDNK